MQSIFWHTKTQDQIFAHFKTSIHGLSAERASAHREQYGPNTLPEAKTDTVWKIFLRQFQSPLIYILFGASILILFIHEYADAIIILFVLLFNAIVGTIQEGKAQNTLAALKHLVQTNAVVLRNGIEEIMPDADVVPGDILVLHEGDKVPADARIIDAHNLTIDESSLTGESQPVYKTTDVLPRTNTPTGDQKNMAFKGTNIVAGSGLAVVIATGAATIIGYISKKIASIESEDPLKRDMRKLSRIIIIAAAIICMVLFVAGLIAGKSLVEMFTTVVSLSVSIIPEGLPIVLTLVLATGVWRMSRQNALVKKLQAVESLGQARIIAVDKTGTITKNELTVTQIFVDGKTYTIEGNGYEPTGSVTFEEKPVDHTAHHGLGTMAKLSALCATARVAFSEEKKIWQVSGDPTEAALLVFGEKLGYRKAETEEMSPQITEIPFSSETKYHAVLHKDGAHNILTVVGAPENVLDLCASVWSEEKNTLLTGAERHQLEEIVATMSSQGLRVLAVATKTIPRPFISAEEISTLVFVGFVGMKDVLRMEVKDAVTRAHHAGIKVVMITGDHKLTAQAIATEAGIFTPGSIVVTGAEIETMSTEHLSKILEKVSVFARVSPEHKLRIIEGYKTRGEIIAMTGDGVNDAPSLVAADLGVAMGKIGTEVAKEAADIVLLDDNFGSIISAVEEGRSIYKTIKKVMLYLFSTGMGEVLTIAGAIFLNLPLPVLASQIIWLNFVTDGFLDVSLGMEPKEKGLLGNHAFASSSFIDRLMAQRIFTMAIPMAIGSLWMFYQYLDTDLTKAWSITMTTLAVFQWFNAWNCRHDTESLLKLSFWSNKYLIWATLTVVMLQIFALYTPFMQRFLHTSSLSLNEWLQAIAVASSIIIVEEMRKFFRRRMSMP